MSAKPTILIVGDYNRKSFLDLFQGSKGYFNFYFLEYASRREVVTEYHNQYGTSIFWGDYTSAKDLLHKINPHKVLFFFIESYYHVILNLTCKLLNIPTYHIDHGLRDININIRLEGYFKNQKEKSVFLQYAQKVVQFLPRLSARSFLMKSAKELPVKEAEFFMHFYNIRKKYSFLDAFKLINSPLRLADAYITFSPKVYEFHKLQDQLPEGQKVHFIGLPSFDHFASIKPKNPVYKQIILIDQGLSERRLLGWTPQKYKSLIYEITSICAKSNFKLYVKPHPTQIKSEKVIWESAPHVKVINETELANLLPSTSIIIGYFSTLLLPLAALPHTTLITLENHPAGRLDVSKSFIDAGVAHPVYSLDELSWALENIEQLHVQQLPNKKQFEKDWLYKFDGRSGERLRTILLSDEL